MQLRSHYSLQSIICIIIILKPLNFAELKVYYGETFFGDKYGHLHIPNLNLKRQTKIPKFD